MKIQTSPARFETLAAWPAVERARRGALSVGRLRQHLADVRNSAAQSTAVRPLLVVLDTNVVLDLLYWKDRHCAALAADLAAGRLIAATSPACLEELADVVSRPQFGLSAESQIALIDDYVQGALVVSLNEESTSTARCRDKDDQKFLDLAEASSAELLFTKDKLVRRAAKKLARSGLRTLAPADWTSLSFNDAPERPRSEQQPQPQTQA